MSDSPGKKIASEASPTSLLALGSAAKDLASLRQSFASTESLRLAALASTFCESSAHFARTFGLLAQSLRTLPLAVETAKRDLSLAGALLHFHESISSVAVASQLTTTWQKLPVAPRDLATDFAKLLCSIELIPLREAAEISNKELLVFVDEGLPQRTSPNAGVEGESVASSTAPLEGIILDSAQAEFFEVTAKFLDDDIRESSEFANIFRRYILRFQSVGLSAFARYCTGFEGARLSVVEEGLLELGRMCDKASHDERMRLLRMCLAHPHPIARDAAGLGLSLLGDKRAIPALAHAVSVEKYPLCRTALEHSLRELSY